MPRMENCDPDVYIAAWGFPPGYIQCFNMVFYVLDFLVFSSDCSPGPGYKIDPRITRAGVDGTPSYSMLGRQQDQRKYTIEYLQTFFFRAF